MKQLLLALILVLAPVLHAGSNSTGYYTTQTFTVSGSAYDMTFWVSWWADDYPMGSAPGILEVLDGGGGFVSRINASNYQGSGPSVTVSGSGTVDGVSSNVGRYGGGSPADGFLSGTWHLTGLSPGTYTIRLWQYETWDTSYSATTVTTNTDVFGGSEPAAPNRAPTIGWSSAPGSAGHGGWYYVAAQAHDDDGNLAQVNVWKNGVPFAFAGGGSGTDGDSGNWTNDGGPQTVTFTAQAMDAAGAGSGVISFTMTINPPPLVQYTVTATSGSGGSVTGGGTFEAGTVVSLTATPDSFHDFAGWSGDAGGTANPLAVTVDRDKAIQATFTPKLFTLTTSATAGGSATPGGSYPPGTIVTLTAAPDAFSRFSGWTGDVTSSMSSIAVTMTAARTVQAIFIPKLTQTVSFANPGSRSVASPAFSLGGTASSGLPVNYVVLSGPATVTGDQLQVTGPGAVTVRAVQPGDGTYLAAPAVNQTFNSVGPSLVRFQPAAHTVLRSQAMESAANVLLANP